MGATGAGTAPAPAADNAAASNTPEASVQSETSLEQPEQQLQAEGQAESALAESPSAPAIETEVEPAPETLIDPAQLGEKAGKAFAALRTKAKLADELSAFKATAEPIANWVQERGGIEPVQQDVQMLDALFAPELAGREPFYDYIGQQGGPEALTRMALDFASTPFVLDQALLNLGQGAGVTPDDLPALRELIASGAWRSVDQQAAQAFTPDPAILQSIPEHLRETYQSLPPEVRADFDQRPESVRTWDLQQAYIAQTAQREAQRGRLAQQRAQEAADKAAKAEAKNQAYVSVQGIVRQKLASIFKDNEQAIDYTLSAVESKLYSSPKGETLWNELEAHLDEGEMREFNKKLPLIIAEAEAIASQQGKWLNEREDKARKFDDLMRLGSMDQIVQMVNQLRGAGRDPQGGQPVAPNANGNIPHPERRGQFDPANIAAYGR